MPCLFWSIWFLSFDFKTLWLSARAIELTSEERLIYVNLRLLVCQVVDQRQFTVGVEGGFESSRAFFKYTWLACIGAPPHPCGCLSLPFNSRVQTGDILTSDDLVFFVGFSPCTWVSLSRARKIRCLGQLMFLWAKAIQLLSRVCSCACV